MRSLSLCTLSSKNAAAPVQRRVPLLRQLGEEKIENDDGDKAFHKTFRTRPAHTARARSAGETFVAPDQANRAAKENALDDSFHNLPVFHTRAAVFPVRAAGHTEVDHGDEP